MSPRFLIVRTFCLSTGVSVCAVAQKLWEILVFSHRGSKFFWSNTSYLIYLQEPYMVSISKMITFSKKVQTFFDYLSTGMLVCAVAQKLWET